MLERHSFFFHLFSILFFCTDASSSTLDHLGSNDVLTCINKALPFLNTSAFVFPTAVGFYQDLAGVSQFSLHSHCLEHPSPEEGGGKANLKPFEGRNRVVNKS